MSVDIDVNSKTYPKSTKDDVRDRVCQIQKQI